MKAVPKKRRAAETTDDDSDVLKAKHAEKVAEPKQRCLEEHLNIQMGSRGPHI